jgi:P-type conjugative transfer protein TrbJ
MKFRHRILAAKIGLLLSVNVSATGIPVFDAANLGQNTNTALQSTVSAIENVAQTLKQIDEYATQLQQYQDQITNTLAPAQYIWDQANATIGKVMGLVDQVSYYKSVAGNLDGYLAKYQDANYYLNSSCLGTGGCSSAQRTALTQSAWDSSMAQKRANDAVWKGIEQQDSQLRDDARQLERLQSQASSAGGRMEAIQAGVQLASNQSAQLLQIRTLLLQQQQFEAARAQAVSDREAQELAAHRQSTSAQVAAGTVDKI